MIERISPDEVGAGRPELSSRSHVVRGGAVVVVSNVVSKLLGLASAIVVARSLAVTGFGEFSFAIAYGSFFALFADLGLDSIATRELASTPESDEGRLIGSMLAIKGAVITVTLAIAGAGLFLYSPSLRIGGLVATVALVKSLPGTLGLVLVARLRMLPLAVLQVGGSVLTVASYILAAELHNSPLAFVIAESVTTLVTGAAIGIYAWRSVGSLAVDRQVVRKLVRSTAPLAVSAVAVLVYRRLDQLLLPVLSDVKELGQYAGAVKIVDSLNVVPEAVAIVALPVLARRATTGSDTRMASAGFRLLAAIVLPAAAVGTVVGGPIMARVFGSGFGSAGGALAVLLWAHFFGFAGTLLAQLLVARRQERALAGLLVAAAGVNVVVNAWAIPRYGEMGAAWASFAAYAVPFALGAFFGPARSAVRICLRSSVRPMLGAAVLLAILIGVQPNLGTALVVTAVAWPLLLFITKSTSIAEARMVLTAARGRPDPVSEPDD